jgi:hypothetical protein
MPASSNKLFFGLPRFLGIFGGFSISSPFFGRPGLRLTMLEFGDTTGEVDVGEDIGGKTGCDTIACGVTAGIIGGAG